MKRLAPIILLILLALTLSACGRTDIASLAPAPTPALSTKMVASLRGVSETVAAGTVPRLNTDDHIVYLKTPFLSRAEPDEAIRRGDAIEALYTLLANPIEGSCSFSDVAADSALYKALSCLTAWGVVANSDGEFRPDDMLSRAQLMTMLASFYPPEPDSAANAPYIGSFLRNGAGITRLPDNGMSSFSDITGHWAETAIENAVDRGWIDAGGRFFPDAAVTRAEFCHILNRLLGRCGDVAVILLSGEYAHYTDLPSDHEYYADVIEATCGHEFYFNEAGTECWCSETLEPGFHRAGGRLYYAQEDGSLLRSSSFGVWEFDENGCYTTGLDDLDSTLRGILLDLGTDDMSDWSALYAAYGYCIHGTTYLYHNWYTYGFDGQHDEFALRARRFFANKSGVCYDFASGFGYLARSLGFRAYVVKGSINSERAAHGFVIIPENGTNYIYDPEYESVRDYLRDYRLFRIRNYIGNNGVNTYYYTSWW